MPPRAGCRPHPPGAGVPGSGCSCVLEADAGCQAWLPCQAGGRFRFPCQCLAARKGLPRHGARPLFLAPQSPPPPSRPCHGCHLLSPCHVPGTLPTCSRRVLVTALGAGDPLPPSPVQTLESTCPVAMLPRAALCLGHCYCHFRVTVPRVAGKAGRGPARQRPGSWKEVSLLPRGPRTVGAGGSPGVAGRGAAGCPGGEGWP